LGQGYNNVTAHYNGYFYSREEVAKIEQVIFKSQTDDYNRILKLFPTLDSTVANGYDKEAQEAIKMASLAIQRHPHSKWVDDAYILVGKARLYTLDWANAIQTFKYVNSKSKNPDARHQAIIVLLRTFVEHQEYSNAQAAVDFLLKEKLSNTNLKNFYLEKAYYHQVKEDYDNMVRSLTLADPYLKKKDRRGRIYFIIGQVYQKLGFESEAYNYYKKCLATNPEYEVDFYARLYMAQVAEISRSRDLASARKSFKKLLKDSKNKEFRDKIYYEMGVFELKQKNIDMALTDFNLAIRAGTNKRVDGEAYLRMGQIHYDTLKNYELSQAYYDSAISSLPTDFEGYDKIKERAAILDDFVKNLKTIQWQDSLLSLANLDSVTLRKQVDSVLTAQKNLASKKAGKRRRQTNRVEMGETPTNTLFPDDNADEATGATDWYFGNPSAIGVGRDEFVRVWGNLALEDNWRRSQRSSGDVNAPGVSDPSAVDPSLAAAPPENTTPNTDPVDAAYEKISKEIPRTPEDKKASLKKIEEAYFNLGNIYYFKLLENNNAVVSYNKLMERFPESEFVPEVLYTLYLIYKETDPMRAAGYANTLKEKYPHTTFAKILINPDYLKESSEAAEKQKLVYKTAYQYFVLGDYKQASKSIEEATALGQTAFTANLELLRILIVGKTEDISAYQYQLDEFIKKNPDADVTAYAKKLLDTSREFQQTQEKQKGITYIRSFEESHYFVVVSLQSERMEDQISAELEKFNNTAFNDLLLKTSNLTLNDEYVITMVSELPRISSALEYYKTFTEKLPEFTAFQNHKISTFVITKDNFDIFYRTKGLDEYIKFFEKNYHPENQ
jgi:tetratricopeptide (TPR) repeat protein